MESDVSKMVKAKASFKKKLLASIPFLIFLTLYLITQAVYAPKAEEMEKLLVIEFRKIKPPSYSELRNIRNEHKTFSAIVNADYHSTLQTNKVFDHYMKELTKYGWNYRGSETLKSGMEHNFSKDEMCAYLFLRFEGNISYDFGMCWGLKTCNP